MLWSNVKKYFQGHPDDLIEIAYYDMTPATWSLLFIFLNEKVVSLQTQYGYVSTEELRFDSFISGEHSYIVTVKSSGELEFPLMIIENDTLEINIEKGEIQSQTAFDEFLYFIQSLALTIESTRYLVYPEFCPEQAFIINGQVAQTTS